MGTTPILSKEFAIIYGGEVIAYATDFTLERNKEIIEILRLGDDWKHKLVDLKDFKVSFNGLVTRGENINPYLWNPTTNYSAGDFVIIAGNAYEAQSSTQGHNPTTDGGVRWIQVAEWNAGTTYPAGELVYRTTVANEKRIYKSLVGSNIGNDPISSPTQWERIETGFDSLLTELEYNDTPVKVTLKPNQAGTTYYFGEGILASLSMGVTVGDKVTFSGTLEGTSQLTRAIT